jgi:hypothetical protein
MSEETPIDPTLDTNLPPAATTEPEALPGPVLGYNVVVPTEASIIFCAMLAHEVNRVFSDSMNDRTNLPWASAPEWQRNSTINGVKFLLGNPKATPEECHENWRRQKEAEGWVVGVVKDEQRKTHPCMLPYEMLSPYYQTKDKFFQAIVRAFFGL